MREKDILEILVPILCVLIVWRITPIFWTFFMTWLNRVRYLRRATPIRQLNDGEREALAFLGGPAYMLRKLVGTTDLPWKKLAHVTGKRAAVYRLQGPLDTWATRCSTSAKYTTASRASRFTCRWRTSRKDRPAQRGGGDVQPGRGHHS